MLTGEARDAWIRGNGPWLYACIRKYQWPFILRDGYLPRSETDEPTMLPAMEPRPGYVYLLTDWTPTARLNGGVHGLGEPQFRVDIRSLDRARFACDEDRIGATRPLLKQREEVKALPGWDELDERKDGETVGAWMNRHEHIVDQSEWVHFCMTENTVAYKGGIPAKLIVPLPLYFDDDWEAAELGERCEPPPKGSPPKHYKGAPEVYFS